MNKNRITKARILFKNLAIGDLLFADVTDDNNIRQETSSVLTPPFRLKLANLMNCKIFLGLVRVIFIQQEKNFGEN